MTDPVLTAFRILNIGIWSALFVYMMVAGGWAVIRSRGVRKGDPMRLSVAAVCIIIVLGNLRWLLAPDNNALFLALYVLTAAVGLYKFVLARVYGRGPKL